MVAPPVEPVVFAVLGIPATGVPPLPPAREMVAPAVPVAPPKEMVAPPEVVTPPEGMMPPEWVDVQANQKSRARATW